MHLAVIIREVQAELGVLVDGIAGVETWTAIHRRIVGEKKTLPAGTVDPRSEGNIASLRSEVQPYARALVLAASAQGIDARVISGTRTYEQQNELFEQGRTKPGPIVTNARGGYSNHNFGIAFDIGIFVGGKYLGDSPLYKAVGAIGKSIGLSWGGDWLTIVDEPHFELRPFWASGLTSSQMLSGLRTRAAEGKSPFV